MTTGTDLARASLSHILVQEGDAPLEADEYADFLTALNNYMAALEVRGIRLGYTKITNISDEITVPDGAIEGIEANMAVRMSSMFGAQVRPGVVEQAKEGLRAMRLLGQHVGQTSLPGNLPLGTGNYQTSSTGYLDPFYHKRLEARLSLAGNALATEIAAIATPAKVNGFWEVQNFEGCSCDISGRITSDINSPADVEVKATLNVTGNTSTASLIIRQNGVARGTTAAVLTTSPAQVVVTANFKLQPGDYIELWASDSASTENITVVDAQLELN